jgi:hypothetical protein
VTYCFDHDNFSGSVAKIRKQVFLTFWNRGYPPFLEGSFRQKPIFATKPREAIKRRDTKGEPVARIFNVSHSTISRLKA